MRSIPQQPYPYSMSPFVNQGIQPTINRSAVTNMQRPPSTQIQARTQFAPQPQFQNPQIPQFRPQQNYGPYPQQATNYQQSLIQQQIPQQIQRQQLPQAIQSQTQFRPQTTSQYLPNRPQQMVLPKSSPVREYQNYPNQIPPQMLTPNRIPNQYPPQQQLIQPQMQQMYPPQRIGQIPQQMNQIQPGQMQQTFATPKPVQQPIKQQEQVYNNNNKGSEDLEKKFEEAINKTKQLVSKYQKPQEIPTYTDQSKNQPAPQNQDNDLQDLALQYEDGYIYRGQGIEPSTRQGYGILCDQQENEVYSGNWNDNQYHGNGRLVNFQAEQIDGPFDYRDLNTIENGWIGYNGGFNEGKMSGKGTLTLTNGERFDGTFDDGTIEGEGSFFTSDGQQVQGYWKDGVLESVFE